MRSMTLVGIILVTFVVVVVNLLANPQKLDTSQMQTMYGGACLDKKEEPTSGCSPTWTCSDQKPEGGTDHTDLKTWEIDYVTSGYSRQQSRNKDTTCKKTPFHPKGANHETCSQRKMTSSYDKGPKYTFYGSCYDPDYDDN